MVSICQIKCYNMGIDKNRYHFDTVTVLKGEEMSTLENTISMLEVLPETDLIKIQNFAEKLFRQSGAKCPFPPKSKKEIYRDLEISRQQASEGKCQEMGQALAEIREKYGL